MISNAATVDAYLGELPEARRKALGRLRELIREVVPDAAESMKYGHPHYTLEGPLFALASQKRHMALYVAETAVMGSLGKALGEERGVDAAKSCIRFTRLDRLPLDRVEELLRTAAEARRKST